MEEYRNRADETAAAITQEIAGMSYEQIEVAMMGARFAALTADAEADRLQTEAAYDAAGLARLRRYMFEEAARNSRPEPSLKDGAVLALGRGFIAPYQW